jgi:hypothetical protein
MATGMAAATAVAAAGGGGIAGAGTAMAAAKAAVAKAEKTVSSKDKIRADIGPKAETAADPGAAVNARKAAIATMAAATA